MKKNLCKCGCGNEVKINTRNDATKGYVKGEPRDYIRGHSARGRVGTNANAWKGGSYISEDGYRYILKRDHPKSMFNGYVPEHVLVIEKALGKQLPPGSIPHHVDENRANNLNNNLVLCNDMAYHKLLHNRADALRISGHADWIKCQFCGKYGPPESILVNTKRYHKTCNALYEKNR